MRIRKHVGHPQLLHRRVYIRDHVYLRRGDFLIAARMAIPPKITKKLKSDLCGDRDHRFVPVSEVLSPSKKEKADMDMKKSGRNRTPYGTIVSDL